MGRRRGVAVLGAYCLLVAALGVLYTSVSRRPKDGHDSGEHSSSKSSRDAATHALSPRHGSDSTPMINISLLRVTYENCMAGLPADRRKQLPKLHWLHFPKCGTSLGTVVHGYLCTSNRTPHSFKRVGRRVDSVCDYCELGEMNRQGTPFWDGKIRDLLPLPEVRKFCDWNVSYSGGFFGHNPLRPSQQLLQTKGVLALFRDPRRRLASAWNHGKHTHHLGTRDAESRFPKSRVLLEKETPTLRDFARHMHVQGCQVKMLVGGQCGMYHNITADVYSKAVERLHRLAFVGVTDAYNASVCLFHHMWGGIPQPHMFANARPARAHRLQWKPSKLPGGGLQVRPTAWNTLSIEDDPYDYRLFVAARDLFTQRLGDHGLLKPPYYIH